MALVKTAELDPEKTYVIGFHPHGIISMSAFITFATEALNISKTFPGDLQCCVEAPHICPTCTSCFGGYMFV